MDSGNFLVRYIVTGPMGEIEFLIEILSNDRKKLAMVIHSTDILSREEVLPVSLTIYNSRKSSLSGSYDIHILLPKDATNVDAETIYSRLESMYGSFLE